MSEATLELWAVLRTGGGDAETGPELVETATEDPDVAARWTTVEGEEPGQTVTAYRPRLAVPDTYPDALPFVPAVRVFVTRMHDRPDEPGARWLVEDDSDVISDVLSALIEGGWTEDPGRELGFPFPGLRVVLTRDAQARLLFEVRLDDDRRAVQLLPLV